MKKITVILILCAILLVALFLYQNIAKHVCVTAEGYDWNSQVGACIRAFEMTPDIMEAARLAVEHVGQENGLTVISFNSYEEVGAYDIMLEHRDGTQETIIIRNGAVVE